MNTTWNGPSPHSHWICPSCRAYNGAGKRVHYICRVCGASKPSNGTPEQYEISALIRVLRDLAEENVVLNERLTELQSRESAFVLARQQKTAEPSCPSCGACPLTLCVCRTD